MRHFRFKAARPHSRYDPWTTPQSAKDTTRFSLTRIIEGTVSTVLAAGVLAFIATGWYLYREIQQVENDLGELRTTLTETAAAAETRIAASGARAMEDLNELLELEAEKRQTWLKTKRLKHCQASIRADDKGCQELLTELAAGESTKYRALRKNERRRLRESWLFSQFHEAMNESAVAAPKP